jgi:hypothetical protein
VAGCSLRADHELENWPAAAPGPRAGGLNPRYRPNRETPRFPTRPGAEIIGIPGATVTGRGIKSFGVWESPGIPCFLILAESPGDSRFPPPAAVPAGGNPQKTARGEFMIGNPFSRVAKINCSGLAGELVSCQFPHT